MPLRCILVPTGPGIHPHRRLDAALRLARHTKAHIGTLYVDSTADRSAHGLSTAASSPQFENTLNQAQALAAAARGEFEHWCTTAGVPTHSDQRLDATFASWRERTGDLETAVALTGRVNDLIVIDNPTKGEAFAETVFDAAVFSSGRPTLVLGEQLPDDLLRHVVIAWNGSLEGARAVGQSIALLREAERISIITIPSDRERQAGIADLGDYLHWHGIVVEAAGLVPDTLGPTGEEIVASCKHAKATLLVMGAYTHSRLRQAFLGGVTQHILANATLPVLMAH